MMSVTESAKHTFRNHQIVSETDEQIILQGNDWNHRTIFTSAGQYLILTGDCQTAVFAQCRYKTLRNKIKWIGNSEVYYISEKWRAGMNIDPTIWDLEQAGLDIQDAIDSDLEDLGGDETADMSELREAEDRHQEYREALEVEHEHEFYDALGSAGMDEYGDMGRVIRPRIYYAHASCSRAVSLFFEQADASTTE